MKNIDFKKLSGYIAMVMAASFIVSILIFFSTGGITNTLDRIHAMEKKVYKEASFNANGVEEINIRSISQNVNIIPEDREDILVQLAGYTTGRVPNLEARQNGSTIYIEVENKIVINFGFSFSDTKLNIYVPNEYSKNLDVKTTSGNVTIDNLKLGSLNCKSTSGSIKIKDFAAVNSDIQTTSGDIKLMEFGGDLNTKSTSGNLEVDCVGGLQAVNMSSTSGEIKVDNFSGLMNARTTSGNIKINYNDFSGDSIVKSTSGEVRLEMPEASSFKLQAKSLSGEIETDFSIEITGQQSEHSLTGTVDGGTNILTIGTTSGDIEINKR